MLQQAGNQIPHLSLKACSLINLTEGIAWMLLHPPLQNRH